MKRILSAFIALCFVVAGLMAFTPPQTATATEVTDAPWPVEYENVRLADVVAHDNGAISALGCNTPGKPNAYYQDKTGMVRNELPGWTSNQYMCAAASGFGEVSLDGAFYATRWETQGGVQKSELTATKNGRTLWTLNTSTGTNCVGWGGGTGSQRQDIDSASIGADGKLWAILKPAYSSTACPDQLVFIDRKTGYIATVATYSSLPSAGFDAGPKAWTYDDKIVTVDRAGTIHEYDYSGVDITPSPAFTFAPIVPPTGTELVYTYIANSKGTVFAGIYPTTTGSGRLVYHKDNGDTGSIAMSGSMPRLIPSADGNVKALYYNLSYDSFDLSTDTMTPTTLSNPYSTTFPNARIDSMAEDVDGNLLVVRTFFDSSWNHRTSRVDVIEEGTSTPEEQFSMVKDVNDAGSFEPYVFSWKIDQAISGGYLYLILCHLDTVAACGAESPVASSWIHKIELDGFGEPVQARFGYAGYETDDLEYVAMGDSFSSGEGVEPFVLATDVDAVMGKPENRCHRSQDAYAMLLEKDPDLNLNLTAFAACSGAVMSNITTSGQWGEPRQLDQLSDATDLVTLSIGGNDIGFVDYMIGCSTSCGPVTNAVLFDAMIDGIEAPAFKSNLMDTYEAILEEAENAQVYVIGYPHLAAVLGGTCDGFDFTGARTIQDGLNAVIEGAVLDVDNPRLHFVSTNSDGSPFEDRHLCNLGISYFNAFWALSNPEYSFHPNSLGQLGYKQILEGVITE